MSNSQSESDDVASTTDHTLLRSVIEEHGGYPAHVSESEGRGDHGLLRIGFREGNVDEDLKQISWDQFFDEFDEKGLVGVYAEDGSGVDGDRPVVLRERNAVDE